MPSAPAPFGLTEHGTDFDGHNGYVRGVALHEGVYTALTATRSRDFKTLAGATRWLAKQGYDAHGRRLP